MLEKHRNELSINFLKDDVDLDVLESLLKHLQCSGVKFFKLLESLKLPLDLFSCKKFPTDPGD